MAQPRIVRRPDIEAGAVAAAAWPDSIPPLLRRVYAARGAQTPQQARPRLVDLLPPDALDGLDAATALLQHAIADYRHIVVVGDFDCDGATGDSLVDLRRLRRLDLFGAQVLPPLLQAMARREYDALELDFEDGARFRLRHGQRRWQFWRRPLAALAAPAD